MTTPKLHTAYVSMQGLDDAYIAGLRDIFEERIVFHQMLGLKLVGVEDVAGNGCVSREGTFSL